MHLITFFSHEYHEYQYCLHYDKGSNMNAPRTLYRSILRKTRLNEGYRIDIRIRFTLIQNSLTCSFILVVFIFRYKLSADTKIDGRRPECFIEIRSFIKNRYDLLA